MNFVDTILFCVIPAALGSAITTLLLLNGAARQRSSSVGLSDKCHGKVPPSWETKAFSPEMDQQAQKLGRWTS